GIEVETAEERVATGREHLEYVAAHGEHRDVERSAAKVVDQDLAIREVLSGAVHQRRGRRLAQDALDVKAGELARGPDGIALPLVEVRRTGDHRAIDALFELERRVLADLAEDQRVDLLERHHPIFDLHRCFAVFSGDDLVREVRSQLLYDRRAERTSHEALR